MKVFKFIKFLFIEYLIFSVSCVKITRISVPSSYVIDVNFCRPLILDCDYEFRVSDTGFVLKWYHNNRLIYQWIPPRAPNIFGVFKYNINTSFISVDHEKFKHRGIQLRPHYNLTGDWMCSVQTYRTRDRKIKRMQIIVPERSFELYHHDLNFFLMHAKIFIVICTVKDIFPEPELSIVINNNFNVISEIKSESDENGFFNKSIMARIDKSFIDSPSTINCILEINGTDYIKKRRFIYYDSKHDQRHPDKKLIISSKYSSDSSCPFNGSKRIKLITLFILIGRFSF